MKQGSIALCISICIAGLPTASLAIPSEPWDSFDRKVQINPKPPKSGIDTGLVIFLGHLIPPPYAFEWRNEKLFLNGVQVSPTPYNEAQSARQAESIKNLSEEDKKTNELAYQATEHIQDMAREGASQADILSFAKSQPVFTSVEWSGDNSLTIHHQFKGQSISMVIMLPHKGQPKVIMSEEEKQKRNILGRQEEQKRLEEILRRGRVLVLGMIGGHGARIISTSFPSSVPTIMGIPGLNKEQKIEMLSRLNWGDEWELAKDIEANYDKNEWAIALSRRYDGGNHDNEPVQTGSPPPPETPRRYNPLDVEVSIHRQRVSLPDFLNEVGMQAKLKFIFVPGFEHCAVTAFLRRVTARETLQAALQIQGLTYQQLGRSDTYTIAPRKDVAVCPALPPINRPYGTCKTRDGKGISLTCSAAMLSDYAEMVHNQAGANFFFPNGAEFEPITVDLESATRDQSISEIEKLGAVRVSTFGPSNIHVVVTSRDKTSQ